jgi:DNA-binding transcriptional LysR family regulator
MSVVCRRDHPLIDQELSAATYAGVPHAMLSLGGEGPSFVDKILEKQGLSREVQVRVPYLLALAELVSSSDLVATVIDAIADFYCRLWPVKRFDFPFSLPPAPLMLCRHPRFDADPAANFFRGVLREVIELSSEGGEPRFVSSTPAVPRQGRRPKKKSSAS